MLKEDFTSCTNLFLAYQEEKNVTRRFRKMDLHDGDKRCIKVIRFRFLGIQAFNRISLTRHSEDGTAKKAFEELFSTKRS